MTIDGKIRGEKLQYDINREAAKILALPSGKIDEYEYLTGEETLPSDQSRMIEQVKFTHSHLEKELFLKKQYYKSINLLHASCFSCFSLGKVCDC